MSKQNNQQKQQDGQQKQRAKQKKADMVPALQVRGPAQGRWRAGRHFGPEPVVIPLAELSEDERAAIEADPRLSVREVEVPAAPAETAEAATTEAEDTETEADG